MFLCQKCLLLQLTFVESNKDTSQFTILPGMGPTNSGQSEWTVHIEKLDIAGYVRAKDPTVIVSSRCLKKLAFIHCLNKMVLKIHSCLIRNQKFQ